MKIKKIKPFAFGSILFSALLLSGCQEDDNDLSKLSDTDAIDSVLQMQLNGPDKEMLELMWNEENQVVVDGTLTNPEFDQYFTERYGEYFTEDALDTFVRTFGTTYHNLAESEGYAMNVEGVSIEPSENVENRYDFLTTVRFEKEDGSDMTKDIEGTVLFSTAEDKIGKFEYTSDDGLTIPLQ